MYLFFDTETTGLPRNWTAPPTDVDNWPRLVQIAWILCDEDGGELESEDFIVRPDGFSIPADVTKIHGITTERGLNEGVPVSTALEAFATAAEKSKMLVAHNISFDKNVIQAELHRAGTADLFSGLPSICTKDASTNFCRLPGKYGYKWPTLQELHLKLFGHDYEESHNAAADVRICSKCFFALKDLGVINPTLPSRA
ncbi:MAG: 3'-5' exonuclease [Candidatus Aquicultorales bacterium]